MGEAGGVDAVKDGSYRGVARPSVGPNVDLSWGTVAEARAKAKCEFLRCDSLAIKKELTVAINSDQPGVLSLRAPQRNSITNSGQLRGYSIMEREGHRLKKEQAGGEHRENRRQCGRVDAADQTARSEAGVKHLDDRLRSES
jgi:hypothetical protein